MYPPSYVAASQVLFTQAYCTAYVCCPCSAEPFPTFPSPLYNGRAPQAITPETTAKLKTSEVLRNYSLQSVS